MLAVRAAILDLDGLLIDSEPLWRRTEQEVFATVGLELDDADCRRTTGLRTDALVDYWFQRQPWPGPSPVEIGRRLEARVLELVRAEGAAMPGATACLDLLEAAGLALAVASSSPLAIIDAALGRLGFGHRIRLRCTSLDEAAGKPDPAVYLTAARRLGVVPAVCLAFEDSAPGVAAAHAAGMRVVAVPDPAARTDPAFAAADLVLSSLEQLSRGHLAALETSPKLSAS